MQKLGSVWVALLLVFSLWEEKTWYMCLSHCSWLGGRRSPDEPWAGSADAIGQTVVVGCRSKTIQSFHCAKLDLILAHVLLARCCWN